MKLHFAWLLAIGILVSSCTYESDPELPPVETQNLVAVEQEVLGMVNTHRANLGLDPLVFSEVAYEYANDHNDYMASTGKLSHDNFSARASSIAEVTNAEAVAENVAKGYTQAAGAFENWSESPSHRKTMEGDFTHTAVSVKVSADGVHYYTQLFYR